MLGPRKRPVRYQPPPATSPAAGRPIRVHAHHAGYQAPPGTPNSSAAIGAAGPHHPRQLAQHGRRVVHVAQQVGVDERVHRPVVERQRLRLSLDELDPLARGRPPAPVRGRARASQGSGRCRSRGSRGGARSRSPQRRCRWRRRPPGRPRARSSRSTSRSCQRRSLPNESSCAQRSYSPAMPSNSSRAWLLRAESVMPRRTGRARRPPAGRRARSAPRRSGRARAGSVTRWRAASSASRCHRSWFLTGFLSAVRQPFCCQLRSQPLVKACST